MSRAKREHFSRDLFLYSKDSYDLVMAMARGKKRLKAITIRCSQVKKHVTPEDLTKVTQALVNAGVTLIDVGFHLHGKYHQLHAHALIDGYCPIRWIDGFYIHYGKVRSLKAYWRYMHRDDWGSPYQRDQVFILNEATQGYLGA